MRSESLKRGVKIIVGLILILFLLIFASGKGIPEAIYGILSIAFVLFAVLLLSLILEDRIKSGVEKASTFGIICFSCLWS